MSARAKSRSIKPARQKIEENKYDKLDTLTLQDVQCTVCMGIFVEPVTLPCHHTTCKICFEKTIDNNTLACPLCRKYVGGWIRQRQKNGLMVNQNLWSHIKQHFEPHVEKKLKGEDDEIIDGMSAPGLIEQNIPAPKICEPGLIRREYEAEKKRIEEEAQKRQELEAQASAKLIKELQEREEEERKHLEELRKKAEEEDALMAQRIAAQLEEEDARKAAEEEAGLKHLLENEQAQSAFVRLPSQSVSPPASQPVKKGPMDFFLSQHNLKKTARAGSSSSTDSLSTEMHHFKPVHYVPRTPPKRSPDGKRGQRAPVCKPVPVMHSLDMPSTSVAGPNSSPLRPWLKTGSSDSMPNIEHEEETQDLYDSPKRRERSPSSSMEKSPKRRRVSILEPVRLKLKNLQKSMKEKLLKDSDSGRETDYEEGDESNDSFGKPSLYKSSPLLAKKPFQFKPKNGLNDLKNCLLPLTLQDLTESAQVEQKYHQEQADYEYAMKLQNELNAFADQTKTYDLRKNVVSFPSKSTQTKATPRRQGRTKTSASTSKNEKRRQCTLEESISFSVKMKL